MDKYRTNNESKGNILTGENYSEEINISSFNVSEKEPILKNSQNDNRLVPI